MFDLKMLSFLLLYSLLVTSSTLGLLIFIHKKFLGQKLRAFCPHCSSATSAPPLKKTMDYFEWAKVHTHCKGCKRTMAYNFREEGKQSCWTSYWKFGVFSFDITKLSYRLDYEVDVVSEHNMDGNSPDMTSEDQENLNPTLLRELNSVAKEKHCMPEDSDVLLKRSLTRLRNRWLDWIEPEKMSIADSYKFPNTIYDVYRKNYLPKLPPQEGFYRINKNQEIDVVMGESLLQVAAHELELLYRSPIRHDNDNTNKTN